MGTEAFKFPKGLKHIEVSLKFILLMFYITILKFMIVL